MKTVKCPSCSASLTYNVENEILQCEYCKSVCLINDYEALSNRLLGNDSMEVLMATCPDCGAKLITDINTVSTKCVYCGSSIIDNQKIHKVFRPKKILLFECDINNARRKIEEYVSKYNLDFTNDEIAQLKPVYVPYWLCNCNVDADFSAGEMTINRHLRCEDILMDSSIKIADELTSRLETEFMLEKLKAFDLSYISGYIAEGYDLDINLLNKNIEEKTRLLITYAYACSPLKLYNLSVEAEYILLPYYYLQTDEGQILVNGQSGKVMSSKDAKKAKGACLMSIVCVIISLIFSFAPIYFYDWYHILGPIAIMYWLVLIVFLGRGIYIIKKDSKKYKPRVKEIKD